MAGLGRRGAAVLQNEKRESNPRRWAWTIGLTGATSCGFSPHSWQRQATRQHCVRLRCRCFASGARRVWFTTTFRFAA